MRIIWLTVKVLLKQTKMKKLILFFSAITLLLLFSCGKKEEKEENNVFYTCSMDPQVMEKKPGKCPICHMELTKIIVDPQMKGATLKLSKGQLQLGNIKTDTVRISSISNDKTLSAIVAINQNKSSSITSWIAGRIEKLYFKSIGETIISGQPLYEIYSEQLIVTQKDYLIALQQQKTSNNGLVNYRQLVEDSKQKLFLWGMNEKQINDLGKSKEVKNAMTILSKYSGIISEIMMQEGDYVMEGSTVFKLNDLSSVWVEAQLYPSEVTSLSEMKEAEVTFSSLLDKKIKGEINFINPELLSNSKINIARMEIPNSSLIFKPGMQAYISLHSNQKRAVSIPLTAILQDEKGATIWVQTGKNSFEPRMVDVGVENRDYIEILSGLKEGEIIVISGAYLLQSEYIFKKGADPMAGMQM